MGELGDLNLNDPYIRGFLEQLQKQLDEAYDRGEPIIIVEIDHLENPILKMAVQVFVNKYLAQKNDRKAYLRSTN